MRTDIKQLQESLRAFAKARDWEQFHAPKNLAIALSVEVAELLEHFQWLKEEESRHLSPKKVEAVSEEIADVFIYLLRLSDVLGIDPLAAAEKKLRKNREKYPAKRVRGKALKYSEYD